MTQNNKLSDHVVVWGEISIRSSYNTISELYLFKISISDIHIGYYRILEMRAKLEKEASGKSDIFKQSITPLSGLDQKHVTKQKK